MKNIAVSIVPVILLLSLAWSPAWAATRYVSLAGSDANSCAASEDINAPKRTFASAVACLNPGDTLYIRGGTWTERINLQDPGKQGTAAAWLTIAGYPGETVTIRHVEAAAHGYGPIKVRGNLGYYIFENLVLDGVDEPDDTRWQIRDGNHHFILRKLEIKNFDGSLIVKGHDVTITECHIHDTRGPGYGIYWSAGDRVVIEHSELDHNAAGGIHAFPGPINNGVVRYNRIHHNNVQDSPVSGIHVFPGNSAGQDIVGMQVYGNVVYKNSLTSTHVGPGGIVVGNGASGTKVWNNTIYGNKGYGINVQSSTKGPPANTDIKNNILTGNTLGQYINSGTGTTISYSACLLGDQCGSTGKVTLATATEPFVNESSDDYRLKQGTNPVRDAGTSVAARPAPVDQTDIGAYEQGKIVSAMVVGGAIEITTSVMLGPVSPSTGISGVQIVCIGCTGTPVATAIVKTGSSTVLQVFVSGLVASGSCSVNLASTNLQDAVYIGPPSQGLAQGFNSVTGLSVSGTCQNMNVDTGYDTGLQLHYPLNENTGSSVADTSGNGRTGTLSGSPTWVTPIAEGAGVYFPNDGVDRRLTAPYGSGIVLTSQSVSYCLWVKMDAAVSNKIVFGPNNGANQRFYVGVNINNTWAIGVRDSNYTVTGASEFPASQALTHVCVVGNATTGTATLYVDGVRGVSASAVKSFAAGLTLSSNFLAGCGQFTGTTNCGGYSVDRIKVWTSALSDADVRTEYESVTPAGSAVGCYGQAAHKAELISTDGTNPIAYGQSAASAYDVGDGGGIAAVIQIDCIGPAGGAVVLRFYYSTNGIDFTNEIPLLLGAGGIAMWGALPEHGFNQGVATCCISGALTANHGVTLVTSNVSPTINLSTNHSYVIRLLLRFAPGLVNQSRWIVAKQDNGIDLAVSPTLGPMRFNLVNPSGGGMF